ncbi:response regulator [Mucilaginibacter sp.]|jgi:CheY-like chemotaxis protein|uniref:response regulator n=1 Tax=Mucilaginibacter sp. TaxID=1882438 RepID=UPI0025E31AD9|nr:response regulator [Mucilaginibacter sp.]
MNNILLIEDNHKIRENIARLLIAEGYHVSITDNGMSALKHLKAQLPDLVICEIIMSGMNGYDIYKTMFSWLYINKIPFIQFTAKSGVAEKQGATVINVKNFKSSGYKDRCLLNFVANYFHTTTAIGK